MDSSTSTERHVALLMAEMQRMAARIEELERRDPVAPLRAEDVADLARILPILAQTCGAGARSFTTGEAVRALAGEFAIKGDAAKRLGRLLARADGREIGIYRLRKNHAKDGNRCVWTLSCSLR